MQGFVARAPCSAVSGLRASSARAGGSSRARDVSVRSGDAMCRDVVGLRREVESQGKVFKVTLLGTGSEARVVECPDNAYILDAAEAAGLDLPATCRGGICGACVARVRTGTIDASDIADLDFTVSPDEQAQGMALLCMTRATSDLEIETQCDWGYSLGVGEWQGASGRFSAKPDPLMGKEWTDIAKEAEAAKSK